MISDFGGKVDTGRHLHGNGGSTCILTTTKVENIGAVKIQFCYQFNN